MRNFIAIVLSATAVVVGAIMHYVENSGSGNRGLATVGTELLVTGVIGLASSNVVYLMTRNRRRPTPLVKANRLRNETVAPRSAASDRARRTPVQASRR